MATQQAKQLDVQLLADHPELIGLLAQWFYDEWGSNPQHSIDGISALLGQRMNRDEAPLTLIGFLNHRPIASASLKIQELDALPQYKHWLGSVYVTPEQRGRGFGKQITQAAVQRAEEIGLNELYLYANLDLHSYYANLGWDEVQQMPRNGRTIVVMCRQSGRDL